jgi:TPR repeat protein
VGYSQSKAAFFADSRIEDLNKADPEALFELGSLYSSGAQGIEIDLIEAHKWFNLAAMSGNREAQICRAEVAGEMNRADIAEAQRQARVWLAAA